jgi:hypothetical protein
MMRRRPGVMPGVSVFLVYGRKISDMRNHAAHVPIGGTYD